MLFLEAQRLIKRYYIRPQNIFCSKKSDILEALVSIGDQNCSVYSLKSLEDHDDVHLLKPSDIIYYYDDGILYDKNHVKVMDYDLNVKHEEDRKKFADIDAISDETFDAEYEDRLTEDILEEDQIYVGKLKANFELPAEIHLLDKAEVERVINLLEPEEEFEVGYVNPIYLYKELWDHLQIYKCTEFVGYTGVDFADSDDIVNNDKEARIAKAKDQIKTAKETGVQVKTGSTVAYSSQNKLVSRHRVPTSGVAEQHNTILFYPTEAPRVIYYVKLPGRNDFLKLKNDQLEKYIYDQLDKIQTKLDLNKVKSKVHTTIWGQTDIEIDAETQDGIKVDRKHIYKYGRDKLGVRALYTSQIYYLKAEGLNRGHKLVEGLKHILNEYENNPFDAFDSLHESYDNFVCCICGEEIEGYGNNPDPVKKEGKCCDACNTKFVIPARLEVINKE